MRILGIDPGLVRPVGDWYQWMACLCHHSHGIIRSTAGEADTNRLAAIANQLENHFRRKTGSCDYRGNICGE